VAPGVPEAEQGATLENYEANGYNADAIRHAALFVSGVHQGIYLHGPVGTGKTRLACSILNDLWKTGQRVRFLRVPELMVRLTPSMSNGDETDTLIADLISVPVLALDDVGANSGSDFSRRSIQVITDARADRGNRTIWTSNLSLDDLGAFLEDERLPSRIAGACRIVSLTGPDQRTIRKPKPATKAGTKLAQRRLGGSRW
jgi:DNA replication protein DnaC